MGARGQVVRNGATVTGPGGLAFEVIAMRSRFGVVLQSRIPQQGLRNGFAAKRFTPGLAAGPDGGVAFLVGAGREGPGRGEEDGQTPIVGHIPPERVEGVDEYGGHPVRFTSDPPRSKCHRANLPYPKDAHFGKG